MRDSDIVDSVPYLNRYALKLTRNKSDADDLVSMTTLHMIEMVRVGDVSIAKPKSYMGRVMHNIFISQFCRKLKAHSEYQEWNHSSNPRQENICFLNQVLTKASRLENPDKKIVQSFIDGQTFKDIGNKYVGYRTNAITISKIVRKFQESCAA